ncbi:MAG: hypothetical protein ACRDNT_25735 [Streptosporangiaceae bacterium]
MPYLRLNLITAGPPGLGECIRHIESVVRPALESQPGSLGLSLLASPELGVAALKSFWASRRALRVSEQAAASVRGELARRAGGSVTGQQCRILIFEREVPLHGGEAVRLTRMKAKPSAVEVVTEVFGDTVVPWLAETPGFRDALLFADLDSGQLISETVWRDPQARAASPVLWAPAAVIRAGVLDAADCVVRAVEDYSLVFSSARENRDVLPSWPVPAPIGRRVRDIPDASLMPGGRDPGPTGDLPDVLAWPAEPSWSHEHQHREPGSSHHWQL